MTAPRSAVNWRSAGACRSADPDLFFPVSSTGPAARQIARAKMICAGCTVRQECLDFAVTHGQMYGIWGGTTAGDRVALIARGQAGLEGAVCGVVYAADHPRRKQYLVGASTTATILANRVVPALLDRYLAKTGYDAQQTSDRERERPDNL